LANKVATFVVEKQQKQTHKYKEWVYVPRRVMNQLESNSHLTVEDCRAIIYMICETYGCWQGPYSGRAVPWVQIDEFEEYREMGFESPLVLLGTLRRLLRMRVLERNHDYAYRINERTEKWEGSHLRTLAHQVKLNVRRSQLEAVLKELGEAFPHIQIVINIEEEGSTEETSDEQHLTPQPRREFRKEIPSCQRVTREYLERLSDYTKGGQT